MTGTKRSSRTAPASSKKRRTQLEPLPIDEEAVTELRLSLLDGIDKTWYPIINNKLSNSDGQQLLMRLLNELAKKTEIFPATKDILNAFKLTSLKKVKVVIIGQDPYHNVGQAMGLAFSVPASAGKMPPSLPRILQEAGVSKELACKNGDLTTWAQQGVLLLNPVLTVSRGQPGSHENWGWQNVTNEVLTELSKQVSDRKLIFLLWGGKAAQVESLIDTNKHVVMKASHPSPLATRGDFMGCGHFQRANECLQEQGLKPIEWNSMNDPEWRMDDGEDDPPEEKEEDEDEDDEPAAVIAIVVPPTKQKTQVLDVPMEEEVTEAPSNS